MHPRSSDIVTVSLTFTAFEGIITICGIAAMSSLHSTARYRYWLTSVAHWVPTIAVNVFICTRVFGLGAAVAGTVVGQGDIAADAGVPLPYAEVATFVKTRATFPVLSGDVAEAGPQHEEEHGKQGVHVHGECGYLVPPPSINTVHV